jgi:Protein of unknown function (DUF2865)
VLRAIAIVALLGVTTLGSAQAPDGEMRVNAAWFDLIFRGPRQDNAQAPRPRLKRPKRTGWNYERTGWNYKSTGWNYKRTGGTYRTLCVRLCDGFYFPISYSTVRERFAADANQCEQRCPSRSRFFVHRNPGEDVHDMVDLDGRRYRNLPTAFLHQTQYVADCTCRGNPWDEAALGRHRAYAEMATKKVAVKAAYRPPLTQTRSPGQTRWVRPRTSCC